MFTTVELSNETIDCCSIKWLVIYMSYKKINDVQSTEKFLTINVRSDSR